MPSAQSKFIEVYRASHPLQAHAIKLALEEAGIPAMIENQELLNAIGDLPGGWATSPRLLVEDSQFAAARAVIEQTDHSLQTVPELTAKETVTAVAAGMLGWNGVALVSESSSSAQSPEKMRCLACDAVMAESETTCANCGWTYVSELEPHAESVEE